MRSIVSRALVPALLLSTAPATAQQGDLWEEYEGPRRLDLSVSGGAFLSTDWSNLVFLESLGALGQSQQQVLLRQLHAPPEFGGTASVTYWKGRYGFRVQAGFVSGCVTTGNSCDGTSTPDQSIMPPGLERTEIEMNQWTYGVQGIIGLREFTPGQTFRPYLVVGAGGVTYDLDEPLSTVLPGPIESTEPAVIGNGDETVVITDPSTFLFSMDEVGLATKFALNLGIGTDLRIPIGPGGIGLRLELADNINQSPLELRVARIDGGFFSHEFDGIDEVEFERRAVHNWRLSAGLLFEFGLDDPAPPPDDAPPPPPDENP